VNCVSPGMIRTPATENDLPAAADPWVVVTPAVA
jgi:hypothetical protein